MKHIPLFLIAGTVLALALQAPKPRAVTFLKQELTKEFWAEGVNLGDFNHDKVPDLVAGPYWWEGPDFKTRHAYDAADQRSSPAGKAPHRAKNAEGEMVSVAGYAGAFSGKNSYSDCFQVFCGDFNADGWDDILTVTFPGKAAHWFENPKGEDQPWKQRVAHPVVDNESPTLTDITGDGVAELVFHTKVAEKGGACLGYAVPDPKQPDAEWIFHPISGPGKWGRFQHGLGVGDVNGDGRTDLLMGHGWWEQPESLDGDPEWAFHAADFAPKGAQIHVDDVNGDGRHDVVTSLDAHGHGLVWHEQKGDGTFERHLIMGETAEQSAGGVHFTQPHAVELADIDGDGLQDIVTGKRYFAHGPKGDIDPLGTPVLYWYRLTRTADGGASYEPQLIDDASGVGTQFVVDDVSGDGLKDVLIANKRGVFVFRSESP